MPEDLFKAAGLLACGPKRCGPKRGLHEEAEEFWEPDSELEVPSRPLCGCSEETEEFLVPVNMGAEVGESWLAGDWPLRGHPFGETFQEKVDAQPIFKDDGDMLVFGLMGVEKARRQARSFCVGSVARIHVRLRMVIVVGVVHGDSSGASAHGNSCDTHGGEALALDMLCQAMYEAERKRGWFGF